MDMEVHEKVKVPKALWGLRAESTGGPEEEEVQGTGNAHVLGVDLTNSQKERN